MSKRKRTHTDLNTATSNKVKDATVKSPVPPKGLSVGVDSGLSVGVEKKKKSREGVENGRKGQTVLLSQELHDAANHAENPSTSRVAAHDAAEERAQSPNGLLRAPEDGEGLRRPEDEPPYSEWEVSMAGGGYLMGLDPVLSTDEESVESLPTVLDLSC